MNVYKDHLSFVTEANYFIQNSTDNDFKTNNQFDQIIEKKIIRISHSMFLLDNRVRR